VDCEVIAQVIRVLTHASCIYSYMHLALLVPMMVCAQQAEWTQYSDRADLPMSKRARDKIRNKLNGVDPEALSPQNRQTYDRLKEILFEEEYDPKQDQIGMELLLIPVIFILAGLAIYWSSTRRQPIALVNMEEARDARIKKFT